MMRNKKLSELRPSQLITTFGPGSVVDGLKDSLVIMDIDHWKGTGTFIRDKRMASYLKVNHFLTPGQYSSGVSAKPFPDYHICSKCGKLFKVSGNINHDTYSFRGPTCPDPNCGYTTKKGVKMQSEAYPARFITYCKDGHMDDFPWVKWVHRGNETSCGDHQLYFSNDGKGSGLDSLWVNCRVCGAHRSMMGALSQKSFNNDKIRIECSGKHPHSHGIDNQKCNNDLIPSLRGASNVYFSVIRSGLSIPPWINPINDRIADNYQGIDALVKVLGKEQGLIAFHQTFLNDYKFEEFMEAFSRFNSDIKEYIDIKEMEYNAIVNFKDLNTKNTEHIFKASEDEIPKDSALLPFFSRVIKLERLREVMVLLGFVRDVMPEPDMENPPGIVKLNIQNRKNTNWLPAVENFGEGIFIEFDKAKIDTFFESSKELEEYNKKYIKLYDAYTTSKNWTRPVTKDAKYVLLHTFSHILMTELSDTCGYSTSALKERIYYSEKMCGVLIYTGTSDSEGSLGGIVEMGKLNNLTLLIAKGLEKALNCTSDPMCSTLMPNVEDNRLSGASCHSCTMIAETACEIGNRFLDRSLLVSLMGVNRKGFFDTLVRDLCQIDI